MNSRHVGIAVAVVSVIAGLSMGALAAPTIYYAADEGLIHQVLSEMELEYELLLDNNNDPTWTFTYLGILITIISYDEVMPGRYGSLLFYTGWATEVDISLAMINDWNSASRFGRAYIDDSGDPVIELDLLMAGGVTADTIREYITVFVGAASSLGVALQL
ncbi:YbjN domain-containing protein [Candidatus Bipolaricaulota bacterium]|nr:YbjN domain-containing protein [Candidatus Bipolaricaulota bacterium]